MTYRIQILKSEHRSIRDTIDIADAQPGKIVNVNHPGIEGVYEILEIRKGKPVLSNALRNLSRAQKIGTGTPIVVLRKLEPGP